MLLELRRRSATEKHCSEVASEVRKRGKVLDVHKPILDKNKRESSKHKVN